MYIYLNICCQHTRCCVLHNKLSAGSIYIHICIYVLQCVAMCCSVQCAAVCCSVLQCDAVCCNAMQCVALCCSVSQCVVTHCNTLQHTSTHFQNSSSSVTAQAPAEMHFNTLHYTATHCKIPARTRA